MQLAEVLAAIRQQPGVRLRGLRSTFNVPLPNEERAQTLAHLVQQLEELGIIHQDAGGWYAVPDTAASTREERKRATADAQAAHRAERAAMRETLRANALQTINGRAAEQAARIASIANDRQRRTAEFHALIVGLTLQKIADLTGRTHGAAQAWREGRVTPPQYVIDALRAYRAAQSGQLTTPCFTGEEVNAESVTDLI